VNAVRDPVIDHGDGKAIGNGRVGLQNAAGRYARAFPMMAQRRAHLFRYQCKIIRIQSIPHVQIIEQHGN
jgi:hypothetical protein